MHGIAGVAASLALVLSACGGGEVHTAREEVPLRVTTQVVQRAEVSTKAAFVGTTEPFARATVSARLLSPIVAADFEEGQRVERGQVLVQLESRVLKAQRAQAQAGVTETRSARELAEKTVARTRNLFAAEAASQQMLDNAETAFARSTAAEKAAVQMLRQAQTQLGYDAVKAPIDGYIVRKFVQVGDMATPGAPLFAVEQLDSLKVEVALPESESARVGVGAIVQVEVEALGVRTEGRVEALVPAADPRSHSFRARIVIANPSGRIGSGMFARTFFDSSQRSVLLVPAAALVHKGQLRGVYVVADGRAQLRWLRLGKIYDQGIEVFSGLDEGDQVIVTPPADLRAGRQVEVSRNG